MPTRSIFVLLYAALICASPASAVGVDDVEHAARADDLQAFAKLETELAHDAPDYRHAYFAYTHAIALQSHGEDQQARAVPGNAVDLLRDLVAENPEAAESWALLSAAYGLQIGFSPFDGPALGPKAERAIGSALALAPDNPRVQMIRGISLYHTPSFFGGDKRAAIECFGKSIQSFQTPETPGWGAAQVYIWRAIAHHDLGNTGIALADLVSALALQPDYRWAMGIRETISAANHPG